MQSSPSQQNSNPNPKIVTIEIKEKKIEEKLTHFVALGLRCNGIMIFHGWEEWREKWKRERGE